MQRFPAQRSFVFRSSAQPKFTEELEDIEVLVGQPAKLQCRVEGDPKPDIEWFVDGDKIKKGGRFAFVVDGHLVALRITETSPEDEGEYKCTATNENGTANSSAELIVNGESRATSMVGQRFRNRHSMNTVVNTAMR